MGGFGNASELRKLEIRGLGVHAIYALVILAHYAIYAHQRTLIHRATVHHERLTRIEGVHLNRRLIAIRIPCGVRQHEAITRTANVQPLCQLVITGRLISVAHVAVQSVNIGGDAIILRVVRSLPPNVLDSLTEGVALVEAHDFVSSVLVNLVVNFGASLFFLTEYGSLATVIIIETLDVVGVPVMHHSRLTDFFNDIFNCNGSRIGEYQSATIVHGYHLPIYYNYNK